MQSHYYKLTPDGTVYSVREDSTPVTGVAQAIQSIAEKGTRKYPDLFDAGILGPEASGSVGFSHTNTSLVFTIPVISLPMRAHFEPSEDKSYIYPQFSASDDKPTIDLRWLVPASMIVVIVADVTFAKEPGYTIANSYLVAIDGSRRTYRLPVSNVYEDGRMCNGSYDNRGRTAAEALSKLWRQFQTSRWQSDLADRGGAAVKDGAKNLFRFKALEPSGFEQLPPMKTWTSCCTKTSSEFVNINMI